MKDSSIVLRTVLVMYVLHESMRVWHMVGGELLWNDG